MKFTGRLLKSMIQFFIQPFITNPNKTITDRPFIEKTHALIWAEGLFNNRENQSDLYDRFKPLLHDYQFASQITEATLNHIIEEEGDWKGQSVA